MITQDPKIEFAVSDEDLMLAVQMRQPEALAALYERYGQAVKALALRVVHDEAEAEDLLQEIFVELWNHAATFSVEKGKAFGWMLTLARRRSIDRLRKRQAYARAEARLQQECEDAPFRYSLDETSTEIERLDIHELLKKAMYGLPAPQQQAIHLAYFKGMSQREIAQQTNIPLGTVKTRLDLGLRKIADALKTLRHEFQEM